MSSLPAIPPFSVECAERARRHQAQLTKPVGSLGRLEELAAFYAGSRGEFPIAVPVRLLVPVFGGDHGVTAEGVSAFPANLSTPILQNVADGGAAISVLARHFGIDVLAVDVGLDGQLLSSARAQVPMLERKVRRGSRNMLHENALTRREGEAALAVGIELARDRARNGLDVAGIGEVGIGNTTASAALIAAFSGRAAANVTGHGTGLDTVGLAHKIEVVEGAVRRVASHTSPLEVACALGGLEIMAMAGFIIGCASMRVPVVLDGVIAAAAALIAERLVPGVREHLVAAHRSSEPGLLVACEELALTPLLDLGMRLGEGTGSVLGLVLLRASVMVMNQMATFSSAKLTTEDHSKGSLSLGLGGVSHR
jgi:nicotinate-nucleotide--dimethylbenzimidazole phosphoribosyltransferase